MEDIISKLPDYYLQGLKEEPTKRKLIDPILKKAGLDHLEISSVEEEYEAQAATGKIEIDRCLKFQGKPYIFLQAKPIGQTNLFKKDYTKTYEAALNEKVPLVVFTDGNRWEFYKVSTAQAAFPIKPDWEVNLLHANKHSQITLLQLLSLPKKGGVNFMPNPKVEKKEMSLGLRFWFEHTGKKYKEFREDKVYQAILKAIMRRDYQDFYPLDILQDIQRYNPNVLRELEDQLEKESVEKSIGSRLKQLVHRSILEVKGEVHGVRQKRFGINSVLKDEVEEYVGDFLGSCTSIK